jgi:hypothetical protein
MIDFTLYCFAEVFEYNVTDSKNPNARLLSDFFNSNIEKTSIDALYRVVQGFTSGKNWIKRILVDEELCSELPIDRVHYVYRLLYNKPVNKIEDKVLVTELLKYAVIQAQETQKSVYANRDTEDVKNYIRSLKKMEDVSLRSDDKFLKSAEIGKAISNFDNISVFYAELREHLKNDNIKKIQMAFHGGSSWINPRSEKHQILKEICQKGIPIEVAINRVDVAESIAKHMRDYEAYASGFYLGFEKNLQNWKEMLERYKANYINGQKAELRLITIPILRSYICYYTKDKRNSKMKIVFYTYSNPCCDQNPHMFFDFDSKEFALYNNEFNYLWENNSEILE